VRTRTTSLLAIVFWLPSTEARNGCPVCFVRLKLVFWEVLSQIENYHDHVSPRVAFDNKEGSPSTGKGAHNTATAKAGLAYATPRAFIGVVMLTDWDRPLFD
jgi:hypothetical protein